MIGNEINSETVTCQVATFYLLCIKIENCQVIETVINLNLHIYIYKNT